MANQTDSVTYLIYLRDQASKGLKTLSGNVKNTDKTFDQLSRTVRRYASVAAIGTVLKNSATKIMNFEKAASNLAAITGATGQELDYLKYKSLDYSKAVGVSAEKTIEGFKLIASAKPELLSNSKALADVTKEALVLSKASGLDLPNSAKSLTSSLNQFDLQANQSSRVINLLAAGSKFAAAEIPDLATSLEEFGGVANSLNISIEESAAAVETLSLKNLKGSRAGIQLRNVLLKLGASTDKKINPSIVGLSTSLENLARIQDNTTELTKMFGTENVLAAQTLIKSRDKFNELTKAMTGTNLAYEQAAIMTDNLSGDLDKLSSNWDGFILGLNEGQGVISKVFRTIVQGATEAVKLLTKLTKSFGQEVGEKQMEFFATFKERIAGMTTPEEIRKQILNEFERKQNLVKNLEPVIKKFGGIEEIQKIAEGVPSPFMDTQKYGQIKALWQFLKASKQYIGQLRQLYGDETAINKLIASQQKIEDKTSPVFALGGKKTKTEIDKGAKKQISTITGAAPKTFNINISNLIEQFNVNTENITEGAQEVKKAIIMALSEALTDVQPIRD